MAPTYKLTYFSAKALAEPARLCFAYAGVPFEDIRFEQADWPPIKSNYPWGSLPVLEVDGKVLAQSGAILRYLGKQFNLAGENDFESAKCDELVESVVDLRIACFKYFFEKDEEKKPAIKTTLFNETFPKFLGKWNDILAKNNGFLVGNKFSYADFCVASYVQIFNDVFKGELLTPEKYPALLAHQNAVFNAKGIKEWVEKRPKSEW